MADRRMFVDSLAQGIALTRPEISDPDQAAEDIVDIIGVWEPTRPGAPHGTTWDPTDEYQTDPEASPSASSERDGG